MSYSPDPFEEGQREALCASDALLDRIGSRAPNPDDLDDPLVAALALMAAEIDLDGVPVDLTRAAVERHLTERHLTELHLAGSGQPEPLPGDGVVDERTGLVLNLRGAGDEAPGEALRRRLPRTAAATGAAENDDTRLRRPRLSRRPSAFAAPTAIAPPRSLPRSTPSSRPEAARPDGRRGRRLRPMTAIVVAVAAIVLGTGVSAAVTGGRSVNPLTGLQQVMAGLTGGRTDEQNRTYQADLGLLQAARAAAEAGDVTQARSQLKRLDLDGLSSEDAQELRHRMAEVSALLRPR
jgi:hypothetical protein